MRAIRFIFLLLILIGAAPLWLLAVSGLGLQMTAFDADFYLNVAEQQGAAKVAVERLVSGIGQAEGAPQIPEMTLDQMVGDLNSASMRPRLRQTLEGGLAEIQAFVWGGRKELSAPVRVAEVKESFFSNSRGLMPKEVAIEVERRLSKVPDTLDLALALGPLREPLEQGWNARRLNLWIFAAGLGLLLVLLFVVGGLGSGLRWLGLSWLLAGLGAGLGTLAWSMLQAEPGPSLLVVASPLNPYVGGMLQALVDGSWDMMRNVGFIAAGVGLLVFFLGGAMSSSTATDEGDVDERQARTQPKKAAGKQKKIKPPVPVGRTLLGGLVSLAVLGGLGFFGMGFVKSFDGFEPSALRKALMAQATRAIEKAEQDAAATEAVVAAAAKGVVPEEVDEDLRALLEGHQTETFSGVVVDRGLSVAQAEVRAWEVVDLGARMVKTPQTVKTDETGKFSLRVSPGALVLLEARALAPEADKLDKNKVAKKARKAKRKPKLTAAARARAKAAAKVRAKAKARAALPPVSVVIALGLEGDSARAELDLSGGAEQNIKASLLRLGQAYAEAAKTLGDRRQALLARHGVDSCERLPGDHPDGKVCEDMSRRWPDFVHQAESLGQALERHEQPLLDVREVEQPLGDEDMDRLLDEVVLDSKAVQRFMSSEGRDQVTEGLLNKVAGSIRDKARQALEKKVLPIEDYLLARIKERIASDLAGRLAERQTTTMAEARSRVLEQLKAQRTILDVDGFRAYAGALFDRIGLLKGEEEQTAFAGYDAAAVADELAGTILAGIRAARTEEEDRIQRMIPWIRALELYSKATGSPGK